MNVDIHIIKILKYWIVINQAPADAKMDSFMVVLKGKMGHERKITSPIPRGRIHGNKFKNK